MTPRDVVVVGAGPAGVATAILLKSRGRDVVLLDAARFPRDKVCGESVSPGAWPLLERLGAAEDVRSLRPFPLRGMLLSAPDGTSFRGSYGSGAAGFAVRRERLDALLLGAARRSGVEVREGARVTDLVSGPDGVRGVLVEDHGGASRLPSRLVVGADGRRSVVARRLGLLGEHPSLRRFAVRGYWDGVQGLVDAGEMHVGTRGYCGIAPLSQATANVTFVVDRRDMAGAGGDLEAFYRRLVRERWPRVAERLEGARLTSPPRAIGPLALVAHRVSARGALLVGDAAGFYDPFTGEGVTLALRSAAAAADVADRALRDGVVTDLLAYDRQREAETRDKFRVNRLLHLVVGWPALANSLAGRLARRPELADGLVGIAGDLVPARTALGLGFGWKLLRG